MPDAREAEYWENHSQGWALLNQPGKREQGEAAIRALPQCSNCGLLGQVKHSDQQLVPMLEIARCQTANPSFADWSKEPLKLYGQEAVCAASLRQFPHTERSNWIQRSEELNRPMWSCASFIQWVPGLSIKDHKEMLDRAHMLALQREREEGDRERDELDRVWRAAQDARDQKWRSDQARLERDCRKDQNRSNAGQFRVLLAGVIIASVVTIVAAFISRGGNGSTVTVIVPSAITTLPATTVPTAVSPAPTPPSP